MVKWFPWDVSNYAAHALHLESLRCCFKLWSLSLMWFPSVWFRQQSIMGGVMATLSLEARRRFSRPSFLSDCRHSTARYHRSGNVSFLSSVAFHLFKSILSSYRAHTFSLTWSDKPNKQMSLFFIMQIVCLQPCVCFIRYKYHKFYNHRLRVLHLNF